MTRKTADPREEMENALEDLVCRFRASQPMNELIQNWLVDLIDKNGKTDFHLKLAYRKKGKPKLPPIFHLEKGFLLKRLLDQGLTRKQAIYKVATEFGCKNSTVEIGYAYLMEALAGPNQNNAKQDTQLKSDLDGEPTPN
jgi:hypothetical protein